MTAHPSPAPQPRLVHAVILLVTSGLTVLVTAILGPSLPQMQAHFADVPGAAMLVPLTMTVPMLMMAGLSLFVGLLADRIGRKRLLVAATALYGLFGTAPLYLDSLATIVASRVALGVMEAVLMVISTTMIGDYWSGAKRQRLMSLQVTVSATSAFLLNNLGGLIAEHGWRAPYAVYAVSLVLAPLMAIFLWEPTARAASGEVLAQHDDTPFRPGLLAGICAIGVLVGIVFLIVPVHFGYLFGALGVQSPAQIGMAYGLNSLGVIAGTLLFGWVFAQRLTVPFQLGVSAAIAATGFLMMKSAHGYGALAAAGVVNGVGCGILLPTMVTWTMRSLPFSRRGMGTGAYQSALFFGMFVNPLLVVGLEPLMQGSRAAAVAAVGSVVLALAVVALLTGVLGRGRPGALPTGRPAAKAITGP
jgi:MFS family permease